MVNTKTAMRPLVIEQAGPLPSNRAPATILPVRVQRLQEAPRPAAPASANEFAADWELEDFLRAAGIAILDYETVCRKMHSLARSQRTRWSWYRLRPQDCGAFADWPHTRPGEYERERGGAVTHGRLVDAVYPLAVPESVWTLAGQIESGFGRPVNLYVTHYEARQPDPFLAATVNGRELFVIAEWARPGRRSPLLGRYSRLLRLLRLPVQGYPLWAWGLIALAIALMTMGPHR
jgi:hypothetical protein